MSEGHMEKFVLAAEGTEQGDTNPRVVAEFMRIKREADGTECVRDTPFVMSVVDAYGERHLIHMNQRSAEALGLWLVHQTQLAKTS